MDRHLFSMAAYMRQGQLFIPRRDRFDALLTQVRDCRVIVSLTEEQSERSRQWEKFYWGVLVDRISLKTGHDELETHGLMKALHLPRRLHVHYGGAVCWHCARVIGGTTRQLSRSEHVRFIGDVQRWAATDIDLVLPDPNEELVAA